MTVPDWVPSFDPLDTNAHKGDAGRVLIVGGSTGLTGAVVLASRAALRLGAGLVTCAVPASLASSVEARNVEAMTVAVEDDGCGCFVRWTDALTERLDAADVVIFGPGLGRDPRVSELAKTLLAGGQRMVVDADGLYWTAELARSSAGEAAVRNEARVWTPHPGELRRLLDAYGESTVEAMRSRLGGVIVEKQSRTVVHHEAGTDGPCPAGNPALATGGSGDVLAGAVGATWARVRREESASARAAASLAVWLHGRAADFAAYGRSARHQFGPPRQGELRATEPSTLPSDVIEHFRYALRELAERPSKNLP